MGTMRPISREMNSASSPVAVLSGRISKVGWMILKRVEPGTALRALPEREGSSLP